MAKCTARIEYVFVGADAFGAMKLGDAFVVPHNRQSKTVQAVFEWAEERGLPVPKEVSWELRGIPRDDGIAASWRDDFHGGRAIPHGVSYATVAFVDDTTRKVIITFAWVEKANGRVTNGSVRKFEEVR